MPRFVTCILSGSKIRYGRDFQVSIYQDGSIFSVTVWPWKEVQVSFGYHRIETVGLRVQTKVGAVSFHRQMPKLKLPPPGPTAPLGIREDPPSESSLSPSDQGAGQTVRGETSPCS